MAKTKRKRLVPDLEGPKFGIPFRIIGFQALTENEAYTDLIEVEPDEWITLKSRKEYVNWKWDYSRKIVNEFNKSLRTKWEKIVSIKVAYLLESDDHFL